MGASILIVDDHPGFRAQARRLLESEGYLVIGEAGDCTTGLEAARALQPQLALVDVYLPDGDGFDLTSRIALLTDPPTVILISSRDGAEFERCASESGARGFVPKAELSREAIEGVLQ
ncbi:MAG TPA: response regulator transcription factor [Solirubrobacterales bacterium]|nr:response regulator transcription factor [Solirubrobacterales bacterium]